MQFLCFVPACNVKRFFGVCWRMCSLGDWAAWIV